MEGDLKNINELIDEEILKRDGGLIMGDILVREDGLIVEDAIVKENDPTNGEVLVELVTMHNEDVMNMEDAP